MVAKRKYFLYAFLLHALILFLFIFQSFFKDNINDKKESQPIQFRVVEVDDISESMVAESISEEFADDILSIEDLSKTMTVSERVAKAEADEQKRYEKAKIVHAIEDKKRALRKIEKERIKAENDIIQKKIEEKNKKIKENKLKEDKLKKDKLEKEIKEAKRIKDLKDLEIKKQNSKSKIVKNNDRKILNKNDWLNTESGKKDFLFYSSALYSQVYGKWVKPFHAKSGWECSVHIVQNHNGVVKNIKKIDCNPDDKDLKNSVQKAVMKASPLPLPKDPRLFDQMVIFNFSVE